MSNIRRQSIISSGIVYLGFALGFFNTWLFTREGHFSESQYGLTGIFIAIGNIMYSCANLGMPAFIYKFFPFYKRNLDPKKNDLLTWAIVFSMIGFALVICGGIYFKDLVIRKFSEKSGDLVKYYSLLFPFAFGLTMYSILEAYAWQLRKSVFTNYLREFQWRLFTTLLVLLSFAGVLADFSLFIKWYSITYIILAITLLANLVIHKQIHLVFSASRVTKKFIRKIASLSGLIWGGSLVYNIALFINPVVIAAVLPNGLSLAGIYNLALISASLIQAPQRAIISAAIAPLSEAWKAKDFDKIKRIYQRSSINQLIFSVGMFLLVWLNFTDGVITFHMKHSYLEAKQIFFFIGLVRIVDMGTGVNAQILGTSNYWRFEFFTGIILLLIVIPLNYILTKWVFGVNGPAIADLVGFIVYNLIRYQFLLRKFNMQPFTWKSLYTILLGLVSYCAPWFLFHSQQGILWLFLRSMLFCTFFLGGVILFRLSPDVLPVWLTIRKKLGLKNPEEN
jgi:O-antigen/teichoic acid export membrane protein